MRNETKPKNVDTSVEWTAEQHVSYSTNHSLTRALARTHTHSHTHTLTHFVIHSTELRSCGAAAKAFRGIMINLASKPESRVNYNMKREQRRELLTCNMVQWVCERDRRRRRKRGRASVHTITRQLEAAREVCHRSTEMRAAARLSQARRIVVALDWNLLLNTPIHTHTHTIAHTHTCGQLSPTLTLCKGDFKLWPAELKCDWKYLKQKAKKKNKIWTTARGKKHEQNFCFDKRTAREIQWTF